MELFLDYPEHFDASGDRLEGTGKKRSPLEIRCTVVSAAR